MFYHFLLCSIFFWPQLIGIFPRSEADICEKFAAKIKCYIICGGVPAWREIIRGEPVHESNWRHLLRCEFNLPKVGSHFGLRCLFLEIFEKQKCKNETSFNHQVELSLTTSVEHYDFGL